MFKFFKNLIFSILLLSFFSFATFAQTEKTLDEVQVTTTRFEQKQSQLGKVVTVLDDSLLRSQSGKTLTDVLSQQVGIFAVGSQQPMGSTQLLYMRGARTGYTLILIDGIPVYDPSAIEGSFDLNFLSLDQIARIEILKGSASTLYGSDAVAGVINIITKNAAQKPMMFDQNFSYGSYGTLNLGVGTRGQIGKASYSLQTSIIQSNGFSSAYDKTQKGDFDNDGLKQGTIRATMGYNLTKNLDFRLSTLISKYKSQLDAGAFTDDRDYTATNQTTQLGMGFDYVLPKGKVVLNFLTNQSDRTYLNDSTHVPANAFDKWSRAEYGAKSNFLEIYTNLHLTPFVQFLAGADYRSQNTDQSYVSISDWGKYETPALTKNAANIQNMSLFGSMLATNVLGFNVEIGGRYNHHSTFGSNFTYTLNPYFLYKNKAKFLLNVASSFKAPNLYQLYSPYGNKALKPETALNKDLGVQVYGKNTKNYVRFVGFQRNADNVIFFQSLSKDPYGVYVNLEKQADKGLEIDAQTSLKNISLTANYTYLTGQLTTKNAKGKDTTYNNLIRRPTHAFNATVGYRFSEKLNVSTSFKAISERKDVFFNDLTYQTEAVILKSYATIDLNMVYHFSPKWKMFLDLRNITNAEYFDLYGFNNRRFNFNIGLALTN